VLGDYQPGVNLDEAVEVRALFRDTVRRHLISDVPVGMLLSGGLDSGAVAAAMAAEQGKPIATFTVGFDLPGSHNELAEARVVAQHLGSDHHEDMTRCRRAAPGAGRNRRTSCRSAVSRHHLQDSRARRCRWC
jgi:7-cyano-7-deazaguanine synthase in queuosine biosynthesis